MNTDAYIERMNWANDPRTQAADRKPILTIERDDGEFEEIALPTRWVVCPVCEGEGKHANPAIDCGGLVRDELDYDPDFAEDYFGGMYDVTCNRCEGRRVVHEVDWNRLTPEQSEEYERQLREEAEYQALCRAEFVMGA